MCAGIKPGKATLEGLYLEFLLSQVFLIDCCDLQFSTGRGLDVFGNLHHTVWIEIETHYSVV